MPLAPSMMLNHQGGSRTPAANHVQNGFNGFNGINSPPLSESSRSPSRSPISLMNGSRLPPSRPILPLRKSNTSPLNLLTNGRSDLRPPIPPMRPFHAKPLKEIHTIPRLTRKPLLDSRILVSRSPSPALLEARKFASQSIETGNIADLHAKKTYSRSPSPLSHRSSSSSYNTCSGSNFQHHDSVRSLSVCSSRVSRSCTPRRVFPQFSSNDISKDMSEMNAKEQSPVIFDANLTFVLGCDKQKVRQNFRPTPAHMDESTASSHLSARIEDFLKRTDHVMDEWRNLGHKDDNEMNVQGSRLGKSKSAANIMIKGFQLYSRSGSVCRSGSFIRDFSEDRTTISEVDEVIDLVYSHACYRRIKAFQIYYGTL